MAEIHSKFDICPIWMGDVNDFGIHARRGRSDYFYIRAVLEWVVGVISKIAPVCMGTRRTFGADADSLNTVDGEVSDKTSYFV